MQTQLSATREKQTSLLEWFCPAASHHSCCLLVVSAAASPSFASHFGSSPSKDRKKYLPFIIFFSFYYFFFSYNHCLNWAPCGWVRMIFNICTSHTVFLYMAFLQVFANRYNLIHYTRTHINMLFRNTFLWDMVSGRIRQLASNLYQSGVPFRVWLWGKIKVRIQAWLHA